MALGPPFAAGELKVREEPRGKRLKLSSNNSEMQKVLILVVVLLHYGHPYYENTHSTATYLP